MTEKMTQDTFQPPEGFVEDTFWYGGGGTPRWLKKSRKFAHQKKRPTFLELDRKTRRNLAVSMRWRIRTDPNGAGVFHTHDYLPGSKEWPGDSSGQWAPHAWADFYFMSAKPISQGLFYNVYAKTSLEAAAEAIEEMAEEAVKAQMSEADRKATRLRSFSKENPGGGSTMVFAPDVGAESLGGLTRQGAQAKWLRERWEELHTLVQIKPKAEIEKDYQYGVGLHMIVPQISVDTRTIPEIIEQFIARGEVAYEDPAFDLSAHIDVLRLRLGATMWRWDNVQARAEGREMEEPAEELWPYFDTQSNAIRI